MADLLKRVLTAVGYALSCALSAEQAGDLLNREHFDLVLTDLVMTGMGGEYIVRKVKEDYPDAEIIVIAAHASVGSAI